MHNYSINCTCPLSLCISSMLGSECLFTKNMIILLVDGNSDAIIDHMSFTSDSCPINMFHSFTLTPYHVISTSMARTHISSKTSTSYTWQITIPRAKVICAMLFMFQYNTEFPFITVRNGYLMSWTENPEWKYLLVKNLWKIT